ncbi:MAG TPA: Rrf2 family transcriptional regulator [Candidatus Acidoferrales bacterium]|nr:Rrf2 family transcriptional regulator [Candidatus Acidoferrales bacterium]
MRISAKGEYAAKAVLHLSMNYPQVVTIHEVAASHRIPLKYLEQILLALRKAGLLESRRGVHGGYTLARPPAEISVGEVLRAVDGKFARASCLEEDPADHHGCPEANACGLRQVWANLQATVERILFDTSFAEVCGRNREAQAKNGQLVGGFNPDR